MSESIIRRCHKDFVGANLRCDEEFIRRFVAALLAKRFVILTGLAGSGKTKLAQAFARWISPIAAAASDPFTAGTEIPSDRITYIVKRADRLAVEFWNDPDEGKAIKVVLPRALIQEWVEYISANKLTDDTAARQIREGVAATTKYSTQLNSFETIFKAAAFAALAAPQVSRASRCYEVVCNRATAREQSSYHRFHVYRADELSGGATIESPLPERDGVEDERPVPPAEHSVVVGWCDSEQQLDWIRRSGLYNFRAGLRHGSIRLEPTIADARHLLLHGHGNEAWPGLWRIKKRGPRIFTAQELLRNGYPSSPEPDVIYAVFDVEPDSFYNGWKWDYAKLPGKKAAFASAEPFAVSLVNVLAVHRV